MTTKHFGVALAGVLLALAATVPASAGENGHLADSELAEIYLPGGKAYLQKDAAAAWNALRQFCLEKGIDLYPAGPNSAYRTLAVQVEMKRIYKGNAATPGTSNHGLGLAVDVATHAMRSAIDEYGARFGWSKKWSDASWEWWHLKYKAGVWNGEGRVSPTAAPDASEQPLPDKAAHAPSSTAKASTTTGVSAAADRPESADGFTDALQGLGAATGPAAPGSPGSSSPPADQPADSASPPSSAAGPSAPAPSDSAPPAAAPEQSVSNAITSPINQPFDSESSLEQPESASPSTPDQSAAPSGATVPAATAPGSPVTPVAPSARPVLKRGDGGPAVVTLQTFLAQLGYTIAITGTFDARTDYVVRRYERSNRLRPDGVVGATVWQDLTTDVARSGR